MKTGCKLRVTKVEKGKGSAKKEEIQKKAVIYSLDKYKITVMYKKNGKDMYKESFNIADITEQIVKIDIWEKNHWERLDKEAFKELGD